MMCRIRLSSWAVTIACLVFTATHTSADEPKSGFAFDVKAGEAKFKALDGNEDDRLSGTEMRGIERYDVNGDARITREEFLGGLSTEQMRAAGVSDEAASSADEPSSIVVPSDTNPFEVMEGDSVRLVGQGIAGSEITADIRGPGKLVRKAYIAHVTEGQMMIGGATEEFEIKPTGPGPITVVITVTYPTGGPPKKTTYKFSLRKISSDPQ
ncbi:MAG: hypothetical protein C0483_08930 [Pirellula sp.]|nr:hypothetical protein [Pirellula sp.]